MTMKFQLLTSAAAMAVFRAASAAASKEAASSVGTDRRSLTGISFSQQAEDAIEVFKNGDEGGSKKEKKASTGGDGNSRSGKEKKDAMSSNSKSNRSSHSSSSSSSDSSGDRKSHKHSRYGRFTVGMCDPDGTKPEHEDICEDIWETMCNPDDEIEVDDEYCDWLGFTDDVDWVESEDFDYEMVYKKGDDGGFKNEKKASTGNGDNSRSGKESKHGRSSYSKSNRSGSSSSSSSSGDNKSRKYSTDGRFTEDMCDPDGTKPEHEDICEDIWETMCNPDDEIEFDDEYCDWLGFTDDVEWYDDEDFDFEIEDLYDSDDRARKNLRG
jgi:hypothetical protein